MKKIIAIATLALTVSFASTSCEKKANDADLQTSATKIVTTNPNATVEVKDGVAHLSGTFADKTSEEQMVTSLKKIPGINDVMDMSTVVPATPPALVNSVDPANMQKVTDALKDFPSAKAEVINGVLTLTGTVSSIQAKKIKMSVDALNIGKYNNNLTVK
jgi:hyperosmotically inducible protein